MNDEIHEKDAIQKTNVELRSKVKKAEQERIALKVTIILTHQNWRFMQITSYSIINLESQRREGSKDCCYGRKPCRRPKGKW